MVRSYRRAAGFIPAVRTAGVKPAARWLVFATLLCAGCQGKGDLTGQVIYKGKPMLVGSVLAVGSDGVPKSCIIEDGVYRLESLPTGEIKLAVNSPNPEGQRVALRKPEAGSAIASKKDWIAIPEKYAAFETSGLSCSIRGGRNTHDIKLE